MDGHSANTPPGSNSQSPSEPVIGNEFGINKELNSLLENSGVVSKEGKIADAGINAPIVNANILDEDVAKIPIRELNNGYLGLHNATAVNECNKEGNFTVSAGANIMQQKNLSYGGQNSAINISGGQGQSMG
jgi:hypothetical protein